MGLPSKWKALFPTEISIGNFPKFFVNGKHPTSRLWVILAAVAGLVVTIIILALFYWCLLGNLVFNNYRSCETNLENVFDSAVFYFDNTIHKSANITPFIIYLITRYLFTYLFIKLFIYIFIDLYS